MKTLILNGSPRRDGDTARLIGELRGHLEGEIVELSCFDGFSPCTDCRSCWAAPGCSLPDGMRGIYPFFEDCDNLVIASPVWFTGLSGPLLNLASRLIQPYFAARRFRDEVLTIRQKRGVLVLAAGSDPDAGERAASPARMLFRSMNALPVVANIFSLNTDALPAAEDMPALEAAREAARLLNRLYRES